MSKVENSDKKENISGVGSSLSEFGDMENPSENPGCIHACDVSTL